MSDRENDATDDALPVVEVPMSRLSPEALAGLIEEFVTRDGTDYGAQENTLAQKRDAVFRQLERGEVVIVFEAESESCNIITKESLARLNQR